MISDDAIDQLASRVVVTPDEFGRTFTRAQSERDTVEDLPTVVAGYPNVLEVAACIRYARDHDFAKRLLRKAVEAQVAGSILSPNGQAFAALCMQHAGVVSTVDVGAARRVVEDIIQADQATRAEAGGDVLTREALSPEGYDAEVSFLSAQLQNTMRTVCRITDARYGVSGSGVLIAPHLVATASHVLDPLRNTSNTGFENDIAASLRVSLDTVASHESGDDRAIAVAEDWLVVEQRCDLKPGKDDKISLPSADELVDSHDVAIIRLSRAPGLTRGWISVDGAGYSDLERRPGLLLHHHPGGAAQMVSYGARQGAHGSRFLHSCSTLPGSSGGPLISPGAKLVGIHHGAVSDTDPVRNLGGGGDWLARWWQEHPSERTPHLRMNPLWELLPAGSVGRGDPLIGFDELQQKIWKAQLGGEVMAAAVTMPTSSGRLLPNLVSMMLPPGAASVMMLRRPELDRIASESLDGGSVTKMLEGLASHLRLPVGSTPQVTTADLSTNSVRAAAMVGGLAARFQQVQGVGPIWLLVHVEDKPLLTPVSEALGYLYRALLSVEGGRGRLVVIGDDAGLVGAVKDTLHETSVNVRHWRPTPPDLHSLERYLARWCQAVIPDHAAFQEHIKYLAPLLMDLAESERTPRGDIYASLQAILPDQLDRMARRAA